MVHLRIGALIVRAARAFARHECSQRAAAISYYVLLSVFPLVIFSAGALGIVLRDEQLQEDLVNEIMKNFPLSEEEGRNNIASTLRQLAGVRSGAIGLIGLLGLAWSATAMFGVIRRSLNVAFGAERERPFVQQKLFDLMMVLGFAPFFLASIVATSALRAAAAASSDIPFLGRAAEALGFGWYIASFLLPFVLSCLAFLALYSFAPARRPRLTHALAGAAVASVLFELTKLGFGAYLENFRNYDLVFGSLGAVVAFLVWVYFSANILLLGAEVASELPGLAVAVSRPAEPKTPLGEKVRAFLVSLVWNNRGGGGRGA